MEIGPKKPTDFALLIGVPAAVLAVVLLWGVLGFPRVATSTDIERLDKKQAAFAVELYRNKVRSLLTVEAPSKEPQKTLWQGEVAIRERDAAEKRALELSK